RSTQTKSALRVRRIETVTRFRAPGSLGAPDACGRALAETTLLGARASLRAALAPFAIAHAPLVVLTAGRSARSRLLKTTWRRDARTRIEGRCCICCCIRGRVRGARIGSQRVVRSVRCRPDLR